MGLKRIRIGDVIKQRKERYSGNEVLPIYGVSRNGFIPPKQKNADTSIYHVFYKNDFVFNPARMELNSIALNTNIEKAICSSLYEIFYVDKPDIILPEYLNLFIKRNEFARKCWFKAIGSARNYFRIPDLSLFELDVPDIDIQKKYVSIYKSLLMNLKIYENKLCDLKLVCDGYIEKLRRENGSQPIGNYIEEMKEKNDDMAIKRVLGISKDGFIFPKQKPGGLNNYKIFEFNNFVYSPPRINVGSIGLYKNKNRAICSPIYVVFKVSDEMVLDPDYLMLWLRRDEFLRSTDFFSLASVRNNFSYDLMEKVQINIPNIKTQKSVSSIMNSYFERKKYIEDLKNKISNICPILIAGALKEARESTNA